MPESGLLTHLRPRSDAPVLNFLTAGRVRRSHRADQPPVGVAFRDGEPPDGLSTRPKTLVDRVGDFPSGGGEHGAKVFIVTLIPECPSASTIAREEDGES